MARRCSGFAAPKLPFVVTVAMATWACGGTVTSSGGVGDRVGDGGPGSGGSTGGSRSGSGGSVGGGGSSSSGGGPVWTGGASSGGNPQQGGAGGLVVPPPSTVCPPLEPGDTTYCNYMGPPCGYGDCNGVPLTVATCVPDERVRVGGFWSVKTSTCNPPRPVCPLAPPADGTPCEQGLSCTYQQFGGCPEWDTAATCIAGTWSVAIKICG